MSSYNECLKSHSKFFDNIDNDTIYFEETTLFSSLNFDLRCNYYLKDLEGKSLLVKGTLLKEYFGHIEVLSCFNKVYFEVNFIFDFSDISFNSYSALKNNK